MRKKLNAENIKSKETLFHIRIKSFNKSLVGSKMRIKWRLLCDRNKNVLLKIRHNIQLNIHSSKI
jgi:hypothetical protein